jgi:hypothetical protein
MSDTAAGFALFKNGIRISKVHSTRGVAMVEAFQAKAVLSWSNDFWSDPAPGLVMAEGYEVKETEADLAGLA